MSVSMIKISGGGNTSLFHISDSNGNTVYVLLQLLFIAKSLVFYVETDQLMSKNSNRGYVSSHPYQDMSNRRLRLQYIDVPFYRATNSLQEHLDAPLKR